MDLKILLLQSISSGKPLHCRKRFRFGKYCYAISYEVHGKFVHIKGIKRSKHSNTHHLQEYLRKKQRFLYKRLMLCRQNLTKPPPQPLFELEDCATQTIYRSTCSKGTVTEIPLSAASKERNVTRKFLRRQGTQTEEVMTKQIRQSLLRRQGTQTEQLMTSQGLQTDRLMLNRRSQTEWCCDSICTQTSTDHCNNHSQTEFDTGTPDQVRLEKEAMILILNEIGEMIINQNHLLHNNSTLLGQISEMTVLNKIASHQIVAKKCYKRVLKTRKRSYNTIGRSRCRIIQYIKSGPVVNTRSKSVQTVFQVELIDRFTQTIESGFLRKRYKVLSLFSS